MPPILPLHNTVHLFKHQMTHPERVNKGGKTMKARAVTAAHTEHWARGRSARRARRRRDSPLRHRPRSVLHWAGARGPESRLCSWSLRSACPGAGLGRGNAQARLRAPVGTGPAAWPGCLCRRPRRSVRHGRHVSPHKRSEAATSPKHITGI